VRVSVIQFAATTDAVANLDRIEALVAQAAEQRPDVIVLPEGAMHDFGPVDLGLGPAAQHLDGPFVGALSGLARKHEAVVVAGMFERSPDAERPYNTLVVLDAAGDVAASYRKAHLYDSFGYRESDRLTAGDVLPVTYRVGDLTLGLMTCYDLRFPEFSRLLVDAAADVLVVPAAWVRGPLKEDHWTTLLRARAIENTCYVVAAGQTGKAYVGCSAVIDPMGVAVAQLGDNEGATHADITVESLREVRKRNPSLANRRLRGMR
jgi:predicted amidohydrolase